MDDGCILLLFLDHSAGVFIGNIGWQVMPIEVWEGVALSSSADVFPVKPAGVEAWGNGITWGKAGWGENPCDPLGMGLETEGTL